ncbi:MAG: 1-(5-phosphoribosyl)-5-[(5-phosphoribosylamino)methylideneamino]imidazole-4-carboxamide isomerase [Duncaniella sp.]|nr:1-(5-phosphoribosyl)-5-[(5-phosphoribosylamino)methylideneamino]imidazole-4-carboxamide isomerase [Duncaniella sp.]
MIIPAIDIIDGKCVRLTKGDYATQTTYDASPVDMVRRMVDSGLTRIHAVDLTGARQGYPDALGTLEKMAAVNGARIEWGGGLKTDQDLRDLFNAGATWAVIGSVAARQPLMFNHWLCEYGPDTMILGADIRDGKVAVSGWTAEEEVTADELIRRFRPLGLNQVIVTDISRDGMLQGPNFDLYTMLKDTHPDVTFTVSGGISSIADIERAFSLGLPRIIVGKALYEGHVTMRELEIANQQQNNSPC